MSDIALINHQIPGKIIDIIENSKNYCFLVTPYFKPWPLLKRALEKAASQNKKIVFVFRSDKNISKDMKDLNTKYNFDVVLINRLHTKLYLNEHEALISSMNLYDSSKENNYEIGYVIGSRREVKKIKDIIIDNDLFSPQPKNILKGRYFIGLEEEIKEKQKQKEKEKTQRSEREKNRLLRQKRKKEQFEEMGKIVGYCIRCKDIINYNPRHPYCSSCYRTWSDFENPYYTEKYCHKCGEKSDRNMARPLCYECYENEYE